MNNPNATFRNPLFLQLLLFCFCLLQGNSLFGQRKLDSLQAVVSKIEDDSLRGETYIKLCQALSWREPKITLKYVDTLRQIPMFVENKRWQAWANYTEGDSYLTLNELEKGEEKTLLAVDQFKELNDSLGIASGYYQLGKKQHVQEEWIEATAYFQQAKDWYALLNHSQGQAASLNGMAIGYHMAKLTDKAIDTYREAFELSKSINDKSGMISYLSNISMIQNESEQFEASKETALEALDIVEPGDRTDYAVANLKANLSNTYLRLEEYPKALKTAQDAFDWFEKQGSKPNMAHALMNIAAANDYLGNSELAIQQYEQTLELLEEEKDYSLLANLMESLHALYKENGNTSKALNYLEQFVSFQDSIINAEVATAVAELDAKYESEKREQEIALLNTQNELTATRLMASRKQNIGLGIGLGLFALLSFFLFSSFRKIKTQNGIITTALQEKEVLMKEIHHRVKNNLQVVSSLLSLQSQYIHDENALEALKEGRDRVKSMALIHQNLYQEGNLTGIQIKAYFKKLINSLFHSYNISPDRIQLETDIEDLNLDVDTVIPFGLIVNELVSNSLKHAFPNDREGTIHISLKEEKDYLLLQVKDNGVGVTNFDQIENSESFGFRLINAFKNKMNADLELDGAQGTRVALKVREYQVASA